MADLAKTKKENPALVGLREREKSLTDKLARLETIDANHQKRQHDIDLRDNKFTTQKQLAEVKAEIARLSK